MPVQFNKITLRGHFIESILWQVSIILSYREYFSNSRVQFYGEFLFPIVNDGNTTDEESEAVAESCKTHTRLVHSR